MKKQKYVVLAFSEALDEFVDQIAFSDPIIATDIANQFEESGKEAYVEVIKPDGTREEYVY